MISQGQINREKLRAEIAGAEALIQVAKPLHDAIFKVTAEAMAFQADGASEETHDDAKRKGYLSAFIGEAQRAGMRYGNALSELKLAIINIKLSIDPDPGDGDGE